MKIFEKMAGHDSTYFRQYNSPNIVIVPTVSFNKSVPAKNPNSEICEMEQCMKDRSSEKRPIQTTLAKSCGDNGVSFMKSYKIPLIKSSASWASNYIASIGQNQPIIKLKFTDQHKKLHEDSKEQEKAIGATTLLKVNAANQSNDNSHETTNTITKSQSENKLKLRIDSNDIGMPTQREIKLKLKDNCKYTNQTQSSVAPNKTFPTTVKSNRKTSCVETILNNGKKLTQDTKKQGKTNNVSTPLQEKTKNLSKDLSCKVTNEIKSQSQDELKHHIESKSLGTLKRKEIKLNLKENSKYTKQMQYVVKPKISVNATVKSSRGTSSVETNLNKYKSSIKLVDVNKRVASRKRKYSEEKSVSNDQDKKRNITAKPDNTSMRCSDSKHRKISEKKGSSEIKRSKVTKTSSPRGESKQRKTQDSHKAISRSKSPRVSSKNPHHKNAKENSSDKTYVKNTIQTPQSPSKRSRIKKAKKSYSNKPVDKNIDQSPSIPVSKISVSQNPFQTTEFKTINIKSVIQKATPKSNVKDRLELNTLNSHFSKLCGSRNQEIRERLDNSSNLRIVVDNDEMRPNISETDTQLNAPKAKSPSPIPKKCKTIKLVIDVIRKSSMSSSSESEDESTIKEENNLVFNSDDLSFLDDFDVDEIVKSLMDNPQQDLIESRTPTSDVKEPIECIKTIEQDILSSDSHNESTKIKSEDSTEIDIRAENVNESTDEKTCLASSELGLLNNQTLSTEKDVIGNQIQDININSQNSLDLEDTKLTENNNFESKAIEIEDPIVEIKSETIPIDSSIVVDKTSQISNSNNDNFATVDSVNFPNREKEIEKDSVVTEQMMENPPNPSTSSVNSKSSNTEVCEGNIAKIDKRSENQQSLRCSEQNKNNSPKVLAEDNSNNNEQSNAKEINNKEPINTGLPNKIWIGSTSTTLKNIEERIEKTLSHQIKILSLICSGKYSTILHCKNLQDENFAIKIIRDKFLPSCGNIRKSKENKFKKMQYDIPRENLHLVYHYNGLSMYGHWTFIMDYYPKNLEQAMEEDKKPFHIDVVQALSRQLLSALTVLRNNKYVHADIKPSHILMNATNDKLKLCGFDQSYHIADAKLNCETGTLNYRAPEIVLGLPAKFPIDVWSAGLVMFEMVTKRCLFPSRHNNDLLYKQLCTLGDIPLYMVQNSAFSENHFLKDMTFVRRLGNDGQKIKLIQRIFKNDRLKTYIVKAYYTHWEHTTVTGEQRRSDLAKLYQLHDLLLEMLALDPFRRVAVEFVYSNPFIYCS